MKKMLKAIFLWSLPVLSVQATETDTGFWATANLNKPVAEQWLASLQMQSRMVEGVDTLERYLLRPSVSYLIDNRLSATFGYDVHFIKNGSDVTEQRLWQQFQFSDTGHRLNPLFRFRIEEIFIDGQDELVLRGRWLLGISVPTGWQWPKLAVVRNEVFLYINDTSSGPRQGFDQNRFFAGFATPLQQGYSVELGYQNQYINRAGNGDLSINQLFMVISKRFN